MSRPAGSPLSWARQVLQLEARALEAAAGRLDSAFERAVAILHGCRGKVVVLALGKSGFVARKLAATLSSTGSPAVFLHAADALHGDLGVVRPADVVVGISKSGTTVELLRAIEALTDGVAIIAITGTPDSPLARLADVTIDASVATEADPLNLVPTTSTTLTLALCDALAVSLMQFRGFTEADFARCHPSGQLGRNVMLTVRDVMRRPPDVPLVRADDPVRRVVAAMTRHPVGAACVVDEHDRLLGLVTDGDVRRLLDLRDDLRGLTAGDVMTREPVTVVPDASLKRALELMEDRPSQISVLPVVLEGTGSCVGLVRIHDIYQPSVHGGGMLEAPNAE